MNKGPKGRFKDFPVSVSTRMVRSIRIFWKNFYFSKGDIRKWGGKKKRKWKKQGRKY